MDTLPPVQTTTAWSSGGHEHSEYPSYQESIHSRQRSRMHTPRKIFDSKYLLNEKVLTTFVRPIIDGIIIIQFEIFGRRLNQLKSSKT